MDWAAKVGSDTTSWIAIGISALALVISGVSLGWAMYRDLGLRPRLQTSLTFIRAVPHGHPVEGVPLWLCLEGVNLGPGPIHVNMGVIHGRENRFLRWIRRRSRKLAVTHLGDGPHGPQEVGTKKLEVGELATIWLAWREGCLFQDCNPTHLGITDSFGRLHSAPKSHIRVARKHYLKEFRR